MTQPKASVFPFSTSFLQSENAGAAVDDSLGSQLLQASIDTLNAFLKYVSDVVRKALQAKKATERAGSASVSTTSTLDTSALEAEQLLLNAKPFTELLALMTQLLVHADPDVSETALKALSNIASLYGGEYTNALAAENLPFYCAALRSAEAKKQRMILRILKRLINTDRRNAARLREKGTESPLLAALQELLPGASSNADATVQNLVLEIMALLRPSSAASASPRT